MTVTDESTVNFPLTRPGPYAPPEEYTRLREETPITRVRTPSGGEPWVLTRHDDIRTMLADPRFSSDRRNPDFPFLFEGQRRSVTEFRPSLISMDPPQHGPARRAVLGEFTVRRTQQLRPRIQQIVDECIDDMLAGPKPADLVTALSLPVPSLVICELLGVPYADHDFFQARTTKMIKRTTPVEERLQCVADVRGYLSDLIKTKEAAPTDDLLGRQISKQREDGTEDHEELVALAFLLLVAGHETTANMISLGTLTLIDKPETRAAIVEDPSRTPGAIEELLRYFTIVETATSRVATADIEVGGTLIRKGEGVVAIGSTANRDPSAFPNPDELDIERGARHHVAFGFGPHQCLGQNLARAELQIVFDTLFKRIPDLKLAAPISELPFKDDANIYGLYALPVTW